MRRTARLRAVRFDVDQNIVDGREAFAHAVFDLMGDLMRLAHGHRGVHFDVHIDEVLKARLAHDALLHRADARHAAGVFHRFSGFKIPSGA